MLTAVLYFLDKALPATNPVFTGHTPSQHEPVVATTVAQPTSIEHPAQEPTDTKPPA